MTKKVCKFFDLIAKHTRFERDENFSTYLMANLQKKRVSYPRFVQNFALIWKNYIEGDVGINVSRFFIEHGDELLKEWYTDVFSFPKSRINFKFGQGGTQVDVLITIIYQLSEIELICLDEIIKNYKIDDKTVTAAALISLLEPCVLLGIIFSRIVGQEFRVSIEDRTIENNQITLDLSARPK